MARTPLFSSLKRALGLAKIAQEQGIPTDQVEDWVEERRANSMSRRAFFGKAAVAGAGFAMMGMALPRLPKKSSQLRIAIIGAGMAGLRAAHYLKQYGLTDNVTLYEAANRTGGRIFTKKLFGNTGTTELGGEYIDHNHFDMLYLADLFGVKKLFRYKDKVKHPEAFLFGGKLYAHTDVVNQFQIIREKVAIDSDGVGDTPDALYNHRKTLDNMSMKAYFEELGKIVKVDETGKERKVEPWFIAFLTAAYIGEMGLELEEQSALNFIDLVGAQDAGEFELFGESDESIKLLGGNQQLCDRMAEEVYQQIKLSMRLTKVENAKGENKDGFNLYFNGNAESVYADIVIMTLPFTVLRNVQGIYNLEGMDETKKKCIQTLGMGENGKIFYDVKPIEASNERIWRTLGYQGYLYSENIHTGWDSYHMQNYNEGKSVYTVFLGGKAGANVDAQKDFNSVMPSIEKAFPGVKSLLSDEKGQMNWTRLPTSLGSYICPRPGQVTEFVDDNVAGTPLGNMIFAGEHTSPSFSGFMNGAAESGRLAAEQVMKRIWDDF